MSYDFKSSLAEQLASFVKLTNSLGYKYVNGERNMRLVDEAAIKFGLKESFISAPFSDYFFESMPGESSGSKYYRLCCFRKLSKFISNHGFPSYIPELPTPPKSSGFIPYIYKDEEIDAILNAAYNLEIEHKQHGRSAKFAFPVILRVLIGTGLRIGEVLDLKTADINLESNIILVRKSKNFKERYVPISPSLSQVLLQHKLCMETLCLKRYKSAFFFINLSGNKITRNGLTNPWRETLKKANMPYLQRSIGPRVHDFRHTFAINALQKLKDMGINFFAALPLLSVYLGHQNIQATEHYLQLTETNFPDVFENVEILTSDIYPKVIK